MQKEVNQRFAGKTLLITGGTGSFGNAVLRRFIDTDIAQIRIFSRDEKKQDDMRHALKNSKVTFYVGDVRDERSVMEAMDGVDYCFHAAALKQVPSCEFFPMQAFKTNVEGTSNVVHAAVRCNVEKVVFLSTDKAVYPINAMGISKAMAEKVVRAAARNNKGRTILNITRYGNVMASRGSVIPLFTAQAKRGEDITITNPDMTRFLMSLDDAVNLVLYSFLNGQQGDAFVQKAPASTVGDLAQAILELFPSESRIKYIGTRHGEKLHETLLTREEFATASDEGDYYKIPVDARSLDYENFESDGESELDNLYEYTSENTQRLDVEQVKKLLTSIDYIRYQLAGEGAEKGLV